MDKWTKQCATVGNEFYRRHTSIIKKIKDIWTLLWWRCGLDFYLNRNQVLLSFIIFLITSLQYSLSCTGPWPSDVVHWQHLHPTHTCIGSGCTVISNICLNWGVLLLPCLSFNFCCLLLCRPQKVGICNGKIHKGEKNPFYRPNCGT